MIKKAMTYRQLLAWLQSHTESVNLDMEVVLRVEDREGLLHVGGLYSATVEADNDGHNPWLGLDAAQDVSGPDSTHETEAT